MPSTAAQDEFNALFHGTGRASPPRPHPDDGSSSADEKRGAAGTPPAAPPRSVRQSAARGGSNNASDSDSAAPRAGAAAGRRRCRIPAHRREANTGPKGVIADAQAFEQARRAARRAAGSAVSLLPPPAAAGARPPSSAAAALLARRAAGGKEARGSWLANLSESEDEDGGSDELEYEEGDDAFLARWREARLRELATGNGRTAGAAGRERSPLPGAGPRFGAVVAVDALGFLDVVESSARETVVVVFIYDDMVRPLPLAPPKRD
jgi:hypothetical protein